MTSTTSHICAFIKSDESVSRSDVQIAMRPYSFGVNEKGEVGIDGVAVAEQRDQNRQPDRGFGRGHGQDEKHEHLSRNVVQIMRERDEVDIGRQQHQLDAHQQHNHVLSIQEDAGDTDREQYRSQGEVTGQAYHSLLSASILTTRRRSALRTCTCLPGVWYLVISRRRMVSAIAATIATSRITEATSNGNT